MWFFWVRCQTEFLIPHGFFCCFFFRCYFCFSWGFIAQDHLPIAVSMWRSGEAAVIVVWVSGGVCPKCSIGHLVVKPVHVSANCSHFPQAGSFSLSLIIFLHHVGGTPYLHPFSLTGTHRLLSSCFKCTYYLSPSPSHTPVVHAHTKL